MTLKENVAISDVSAEAGAEKIHSVLSEADFEMGDIKLDDMLSPEFGGIDLSGRGSGSGSQSPAGCTG